MLFFVIFFFFNLYITVLLQKLLTKTVFFLFVLWPGHDLVRFILEKFKKFLKETAKKLLLEYKKYHSNEYVCNAMKMNS